MTIKQRILKVVKRRKHGATVGEIGNALDTRFGTSSSIRARVAELVEEGKLLSYGGTRSSATMGYGLTRSQKVYFANRS